LNAACVASSFIFEDLQIMNVINNFKGILKEGRRGGDETTNIINKKRGN